MSGPCIIAITNQKGGVGKTTTAINLCAALAKTGQRALLIDIDPQGNATIGSGLNMHDIETGIYEVLLGEAQADTALQTTVGEYHILPSRPALSGAQVELAAAERRDHRLRDAIAPIIARYDIVLIDCPPSLNLLTVNALAAAREILIPVQCEYYALEGLSSLLETVEIVQRGLNPQLRILGLVLTMFDQRTGLSEEVSAQIKSHFPRLLFRTVIPRNVRLAEAPSHGLPVFQYDKHCPGSQAYMSLASEVLRRTGIREPDKTTQPR